MSVLFGYNMYNDYVSLKDELNSCKKTIENKNAKITEYQQEISDKQEKIDDYFEQTFFMDKNIAICPDDGTGLYHKYNCEHLDTSTFGAFVIPEAERRGYKPCKYCETDVNVQASNSVIVYVTDTGSKYHNEYCSYLTSKNPITKEKAIESGYTPCSRCNP